MATEAPVSQLLDRAKRTVGEDIRIRVSLLMNEDWCRQMEESHKFFQAGNEGFSLRDLERE